LFREGAARAASLDGFAFSTDVSADRRAFVQAVQAVQAVEGLGILELAEGEEERFARGEEGRTPSIGSTGSGSPSSSLAATSKARLG